MIYLFSSFLLSNILHGGLIVSQRGENPASISYHSAKNRKTYLVYVGGHVILGILLWLVVSSMFGDQLPPLAVAVVTVIAVAAEWLQAAVPAKSKTDLLHTILAVIMGVSMMFLGLICTIVLSTGKAVTIVNVGIFVILAAMLLSSKYPPKNYFWKLQLIGQNLLYLQTLLLLLQRH